MRAAAVMPLVASVAVLGCAAAGGRLASQPRLHRDAYADGHARFEFEIRDELPNGRGRAWHPDGAVALVGTYRDGARHGRFWFYTPDGAFDHQAVYLANKEVWRSTDDAATPPPAWLGELPDPAPPVRTRAAVVTPAPPSGWLTASADPVPAFSTLDRTTGPARVGVQLGIGSAAGLAFGDVGRLDLFGRYQRGRHGGYVQLSQSQLQVSEAMRLAGRQTLDAGGTTTRELPRLGTLTGRAGLLLPIGHDDTAGFVAGAAGTSQRAADAVAAFPASVALRTSASLTRTMARLVLQADVGIDWVLGGDARGLDGVVRANGGVGYGTRAGLLTFELSSAVRAAEPGRHVLAAAAGATVWIRRAWLTAGVSLTQGAGAAILTSVGHDL